MLSADVSMPDIDVGHWRNLQNLILQSASAKPRIVLIHEDGKLLKFVHSQRAEIVRDIARVDNPREVAEQVYRANTDKADFVVVFERRAVDRFFAQVQNTWKPDENVDAYVHRMYATLDDYPDGIATYPESAGTTLGLQWRVGVRFEDIQAAVTRYVPPNTTVVFGVLADDALWASLVLGFGADRQITLVTTADPAEIDTSGRVSAIAKALVQWVNGKYAPCSLGLFMSLDDARAWLANPDKAAAFSDMIADNQLLADPLPESLARMWYASGRGG